MDGSMPIKVHLTFTKVNKYPVNIDGIEAEDALYQEGQVYDGYTGTAKVVRAGFGTDVTDVINNLEYIYQGIEETIYEKTTTPPTQPGSYQLIIKVPENNQIYTGQKLYILK